MALKIFYLMSVIMLMLMICGVINYYNYATNAKEKSQFSDMLTEWNKQKIQRGNCYTYETVSESVFGFGSKTRIKIRHGIAMEKSSQNWNKSGIIQNFNDTKEIIGYGDESIAKSLSMDKLYEKCLNILQEKNAMGNWINLAMDEKTGLMTGCGFIPYYCMDDCFDGDSISSLRWCDDDLSDSLNIWNEQKLQRGDCYTYKKHINLVGRMGYSMRIKVKDDIATEKAYKPFAFENGTFIPDIYFEDTTQNISRWDIKAELLTMDNVYKECKLALQMNPYENHVDFEIDDENELIAVCGFTPKNCIDDCYRGDILSSIQWCDV